jgi:PKHD-type hydroxylase
MVITIDNLLSAGDVVKAKTVLRNGRFIDGRATSNVALTVKNNRELEVGEHYVSLVELVDNALRQSKEIERKLFPRFMTRPIINRYESGMFYKEHVDTSIQGLYTQFGRSMAPYGHGFVRADFSMTLFLDDPSNYDGGELEMTICGEKRLYKLSVGSAVFYPTGNLHSVRPVTRGTRTAAIVWLQSMVRHSENRQLLWDAYNMYERINQSMPGSQESFLAINHYHNLLRLFADV